MREFFEIISAFVFSDTPEGHEYWFNVITEQPQTAQKTEYAQNIFNRKHRQRR